MSAERTWKKCSTCGTAIGFGRTYWACSVSTCNRARIALYFCSVSCWEAHLPGMRHRDPWAVEKQAPSAEDWAKQLAAETETAERARAASSASAPPGVAGAPRRVVVGASTAVDLSDDYPQDVLVVASKLKKYVKARAGMNTSDKVLGRLSDHLRRLCDEAIRNAAADERRTILDRDVPPA